MMRSDHVLNNSNNDTINEFIYGGCNNAAAQLELPTEVIEDNICEKNLEVMIKSLELKISESKNELTKGLSALLSSL